MTTPLLQALVSPGQPDAPVLVLLHGRGSDERDLFPIGRELDSRATVVSVRAPFEAAPWGYGPGWAWYRFLGGTTPEAESFVAGQEALARFLDDLPALLGRAVSSGSIVLGGFSQGGTTALAFALRNRGRVGAVMVFSGFLADHPSVVATPATVATLPIWWGHGTADGAIPFANAEAGWAALRDVGAELTTESYPGMGHSISPAELRSASLWLRSTACQ
ncbi:MAG: dienelactone hydrolase family protein [Gemmatimonadota bacterium]